MFAPKESEPTAVLELAVVLASSDPLPTATLAPPVVFAANAA